MKISGGRIRGCRGLRVLVLFPFAVTFFAACMFAQQQGEFAPSFEWGAHSELPILDPQGVSEDLQPANPGARLEAKALAPGAVKEATTPSSQPRRLLGIMPDFQTVGAEQTLPPPTLKQMFLMATHQTFDPSSLLLSGGASLIREGWNSYPEFGKGVPGFGRYYWRGLVDKTDGNYMVYFVLPAILHEDERYYSMERGGFFKRLVYAASRVAIARDFHGRPTCNISELLGRGIAQGVATSYYPQRAQTLGSFASRYAYAIGRDALTDAFYEFWPDIAAHLPHRHP